MDNTVAAITAVLVLATLVEAVMEHLVAPWFESMKNGDAPRVGKVDWRVMILNYSALAVGILLAFAFQADLMALIDIPSPYPWVGYIVTGFVMSRGANFVHDFAGRWLSPQGG